MGMETSGAILGRSDNEADLDTLLAIEITDYTMIDKLTHGERSFKKVIGQQVREVYPQAVTISTDVVPDIFQPATVTGGWVALATDLEKGERVKLITDGGQEIHEVLEAGLERFRVALEHDGNVFVYGREVDDFHAVDYEAIAMLNVSATQELHRRLQTQQEEIASQRREIVSLRNGRDSLRAEMDELRRTVATLAAKSANPPVKQAAVR